MLFIACLPLMEAFTVFCVSVRFALYSASLHFDFTIPHTQKTAASGFGLACRRNTAAVLSWFLCGSGGVNTTGIRSHSTKTHARPLLLRSSQSPHSQAHVIGADTVVSHEQAASHCVCSRFRVLDRNKKVAVKNPKFWLRALFPGVYQSKQLLLLKSKQFQLEL